MDQDRERVPAAAILLLAVLLGLVLRLSRVAGQDFPLNDGALFVQMTQDLRANGYGLPVATTYDQAGIPFAYPPLAFYAAGWLADTGWPLLDVVRLAPAWISACTIFAFHALARRLLDDRLIAAASTLAFALLPRSFLWFVMGGGLTRAPGLLFALLALHATVRLAQGGGWRWTGLAAVLGAATLCTHAENAWFAASSAALIVAARVRTPRGAMQAGAAACGAALLSAPWWGWVLAQHGSAPFRAAAASAGYADFFDWPSLLAFTFTNEPRFPVLALLGLLGWGVAAAERRWLLAAWLPVVLAANPRNGATSAMVPLAMLAGLAVQRVLVAPLLPRTGDTRPVAAIAVSLVLVVYAFANAQHAAWTLPGLRVLPVQARAAMQWVASNAPADARFLVIDGRAPWFGLDLYSEWFPVLAGRRSVATVQGMEWLPGPPFGQRMHASDDLLRCSQQDASCLDRWAAHWNETFSHLFVARDGCSERFLDSLAAAGWRTLHEEGGFTILQRL